MNHRTRFAAHFVLTALLLTSLHCGGGPTRQRVTVEVPPRVQLASLERIGVVEFRSPGQDDLGRIATRRFTESARRDQGLVRMLDLGAEEELLQSVGGTHWNPATFQALGNERDVRTILVGELTYSEVRPSFRVAPDLGSGSVSMQLRATLAVQLVEAESGASIWSRSASASRSLGNLDVRDPGDVRVRAGDPESVYAALLEDLIPRVTDDFHVHWVRR